MKSLQELVSTLSDGQKKRFASLFLEIWSANGYGSLSKRDTDLLVVMCLLALSGDSAPTSDMGWAQLLKVTPNRARTLRLDAFMRFGHHFEDIFGAQQSERLFSGVTGLNLRLDNSPIELASVEIRFLVEDPVAAAQLEAEAATVDGFVDFLNNRRVLSMRLSTFLRVLRKHSPKIEDAFVAKVASTAVLEADKASALRAKLEAKGYASKSEGEKVVAFFEVLGDVMDQKPSALLKHLKLIFKSQKETPA
jgi:hypothetical protein